MTRAKQKVNLSKKERDLQAEWDKIQKAHSTVKPFAGKYGVHDPKVKRVFKQTTLSPAGGARVTSRPEVVVRSVPMGAGGTIPYDASLEAAKAGLAWRAGQLYNKGGDQYMTDEDLAQMKTGALRRRN